MPDYFFEKVAKETGVSQTEVREVYSKYLSRIAETMDTDIRVMLRNLGSFELDPRKCIHELWKFANECDKLFPRSAGGEPAIISRKSAEWYEDTSEIYVKLLELRRKYGFIEKSIEKIREDRGRFDELFDSEGKRRESFYGENVNL